MRPTVSGPDAAALVGSVSDCNPHYQAWRRRTARPILDPMADYTLKLYSRPDPSVSPGKLIGRHSFSAADSAEAILHATASFDRVLARCDYAVIGGMNGRIVWEKGRLTR